MTQPNVHSASSHRRLAERYLRTCIISSNGRPIFAKLRPLRDVDLLSDLVGALASAVDPQEVDAVCLLANSGLPVGVFLARILHKPLYCYRSNGWQQEGQLYHVLPPPPAGCRVILADSHVRAGFTASKAEEKLGELDARVHAVVTPFDFDELHRYSVPAPILALGRLSDYGDELQEIFSSRGFRKSVDEYLHDADFWQYASDSASVEPDASPQPDSRRFLLTRAGLRRSGISYLSSDLQARAGRLLSANPHGVWHVFTDPTLVSDAAAAADEALGLGEYDVLLGTRPLGTVLALSLAYEDSFQGEVIALDPDLGFVPEVERWEDRRVLLCQETLSSAAFALEVVNALRQSGAQASTLLTLRAETRQHKWLPFPRSPAPAELAEAGVRVFALC